MVMKKVVLLVLSFSVVSLLMVGCGQSKSQVSDKSAVSATATPASTKAADTPKPTDVPKPTADPKAATPEAKDAKIIKAEKFDLMNGIDKSPTTDSGGGNKIFKCKDGNWVAYKDLDFGDAGASQIKNINIRLSAITEGSLIELRLDDPKGTLVGSYDVKVTGSDWEKFETVKVPIQNATGKHTLYMVFPKSVGLNINWLQLAN